MLKMTLYEIMVERWVTEAIVPKVLPSLDLVGLNSKWVLSKGCVDEGLEVIPEGELSKTGRRDSGHLAVIMMQ